MKRWIIYALAAAFIIGGATGADLSQRHRLEQAQSYGGAVADANPLGDILYVDSANGNDGNAGEGREHPVATLARALAMASAGDTIILAPGGSETVTATLAVSAARLKIVCPVGNADTGYTISGAGTLDLMTVSAADVHVSGLKFAHTGATADASCILTTAAADRLRVQNCSFDDSAVVTTFTGAGVEITNSCNAVEIVGCRFKDMHRSVLFVTATGNAQIDSRIQNCTFWVGRATAFAILSAPAGTGTVCGMQVIVCTFIEANGDGAAATDAWDGSDGTNAASGPISLGAAVDQYLVADCVAYTALGRSFTKIQAINAGAAGSLVNNLTSAGGDIIDLVGTADLTTTDTLHGKLGTDTEMADNSLYDLLGAGAKTLSLSSAIGSSVSGTTTDSLHGKIGTDTEMDDNSLYDLLGVGSKTLNLSAAVGSSIDGATTDTLHGKIGTDTEMADSSLYDLIGAGAKTLALSTAIGSDVDGATTDTLHGKIGTDTELGDSSLYDLIGVGSKTLALSAAIGSDLDGATTDTLHGKLGTDTQFADRSVFDLLGGDGFASWPAAAAPADDVSIAEGLRYIAEQQNYRVATKAGILVTSTPISLFTVTGLCEVRVVGVCTTATARAAGATTLSVGTSDDVDIIVPSMTDCRVAENDLFGNTNAAQNAVALPGAAIVNGATIIQTLGEACDSGEITWYCLYRPISATGAVVAVP